MDHACGNYEFDEVYISKKDITVAKKYNSKKWRINNILRAEAMNALPDNFDKEKYINQNEGNLKIINEHDIIDLGNLDIEVIIWKVILQVPLVCILINGDYYLLVMLLVPLFGYF